MRRLAWLGALIAAMTSAGSADAQRVSPGRMCLVEVTDGPGLARVGPFDLNPLNHRVFSTTPYLMAQGRSPSGRSVLWTIDNDGRRQSIVRLDGYFTLAHDASDGSFLVLHNGLSILDADGNLKSVDGFPANARIMQLLEAETMGGRYVVTEEGMYRYNSQSGIKFIESTRGLKRDGYSKDVVVLPRMKRLAFAMDRGVYLLDASGKLEIVDVLSADQMDRIERIGENDDGTGFIVATLRSIFTFRSGADGSFARESIRLDDSWEYDDELKQLALRAIGKLGPSWQIGLERVIAQYDAPPWTPVKHPTANLTLDFASDYEPKNIARQPGWSQVAGVDQLNEFRIGGVVALPHLEAILVAHGARLFLVVDSSRPSGRACGTAVTQEPTSQNVCMRPIGGGRVSSFAYHTSAIHWPSGEVWFSGIDAREERVGFLSLAPGDTSFRALAGFMAPKARLLRREGIFEFYGPQEEDNSLYLPSPLAWRNEVLGIARRGPENLVIASRDGRRRPIRRVPRNGGSHDYAMHAVSHDLGVALLRIGREQLVLFGTDDALKPLELGPGATFISATAAGSNLLVAASGELHPERVMSRLERRETLLFAMDRNGRATRITLPDQSRWYGTNGLIAWPSRNAVLVGLPDGPYLWQNGRLEPLPLVGERMYLNDVRLVDRGPN